MARTAARLEEGGGGVVVAGDAGAGEEADGEWEWDAGARGPPCCALPQTPRLALSRGVCVSWRRG